MILDHVHAFSAAMVAKDLDTMLSHMTDDVVLKTPLVAAPFVGKAAIRPVVTALLATVDSFDIRQFMQGPDNISSFFHVRVGPHAMDGVDFWRLADDGRITEMTVLWRPLPEIAAVNARLTAGG